MTPEYNWFDKVRYRLDNMFSKGPGVMVILLGAFSLSIVCLAAILIVGFQIGPDGDQSLKFIEAFWQSMLRTLDAGTMADDAGWGYRIVMLLVTVGGIFVISTFIGVVTSEIEQRLENLRRGRSRVIESGHTIILGWNEQVYTIIEEIVNANSNQSYGCIVILGPGDKLMMEDLIRERIVDTANTKVVVRTGNPIEMSSLGNISLNTAKAIIVLSSKGDDPDSEVIKTCLAITKNPKRKKGTYHIVAELHDPKNLEVAQVVGNGEIEWLLTGDIIAKVIAQTCRQSGLSVVYTDLMDFAGDEIYFFEHPDLLGRTFGQSLNMFEKNTVMGMWKKGSKPFLNPPMDTVINEGDQLFMLAEDDDQIFIQDHDYGRVEEQFMVDRVQFDLDPENILLLGWNWRAPLVLNELDHYITPNSHIMVICDEKLVLGEAKCQKEIFKNFDVTIQPGDTTDRSTLDALGLQHYDYVILLCYSDSLTTQVADAHTLITLLHLRDISRKNPECHYSITTEMLDIRNRNLAEVTRADDFIVSDKLISLMFSQIAEEKALNDVFTDIFDPDGSEIYLKPAGDYITLGVPVNFYTVVASARKKGEVAMGFRRYEDQMDVSKYYGVVLNPYKSHKVSYEERDKIIIIAEDYQ